MKRISILTLLLITIMFANCERDDICAESTPTTPNVIIEFYDVVNPETLKGVTGLYIIDEDLDEPLPQADIVTTSTIDVPLKTNATQTVYTFYSNAVADEDGNISGNPDIVTITYATEEVYVSRACGFKTIYKNFTISVEDEGSDNWIQTALNVTENNTIENEDQVHIHIRH